MFYVRGRGICTMGVCVCVCGGGGGGVWGILYALHIRRLWKVNLLNAYQSHSTARMTCLSCTHQDQRERQMVLYIHRLVTFFMWLLLTRYVNKPPCSFAQTLGKTTKPSKCTCKESNVATSYSTTVVLCDTAALPSTTVMSPRDGIKVVGINKPSIINRSDYNLHKHA